MVSQLTHRLLLDNLVVVLQRPQDAHNIGAVVRAMKNMGISDLRLVQAAPLDAAAILRVAHHCEDLLARIVAYATLDEALADAIYVVGTAALLHKSRPQTDTIRQVATALTMRLQQGKVVLLFGQEDDGLDNAALDRCHLIVTLPTNADYPALNLAQSVLLLLYEVRMAALAEAHADAPALPVAAQADLERLFQASATTLDALGFFKGNQAPTMRKLRQMVYKANLSPAEVGLLLSIVRRVQRQQQASAPTASN